MGSNKIVKDNMKNQEFNRNKSCKSKFPYSTEQAAKNVAKKFNQTTYCCPVCFCWHNTSLEKWEDEYVHISKYIGMEERALKAEEKYKLSDEKYKKKYLKIINRQIIKLQEYKQKIKQLNVLLEYEKR